MQTVELTSAQVDLLNEMLPKEIISLRKDIDALDQELNFRLGNKPHMPKNAKILEMHQERLQVKLDNALDLLNNI